ncbi:hypothetical protein [Chroococcus sp. FPU101]|uniref:hypothetical protein n=1 Tax=Chroococcus sp. FPU101 TaxID=1974212 RepID=UPI001A903BBD|nr:hypothetical protein [Chroococcus sp. FPU101]GFE67950.1 hypothetical protein CFPU101_05600 [Chroococcus sp. FPU101]
MEQVEALWSNRLYPIHSQINPLPDSLIAPLDKKKLDANFPSGKANLRASLNYGGILYAEYKSSIEIIKPPIDPIIAFKLIWQDEFNKTKSVVQQICDFSGVQLIDMLQKNLKALQAKNIKSRLLKSLSYTNYSLSCNLSENSQKKTGIFWYEAPHMSSFFHAMNASKIVIDNNYCDLFILIRAAKLGKPNTKGYQLYESMFGATTPHTHIIPSLEDVHYLRTYQKLAYEAESGDLNVNFQTIDLPTLEQLVRDSGVLKDCQLLQKLGLFEAPPSPDVQMKEKAQKFLINLLQKECLLGRSFIIGKLRNQFIALSDVDCEEILQDVHIRGSLTIINPSPAKPKEQLVAWVPQSS